MPNAYTLTSLAVSPESLIVDPNNPRLLTESGQWKKYTAVELTDPQTQTAVVKELNRLEHGVRHLVDQIRTNGWHGGVNEMVVQAIPGTGKYLVLEGNRRTAAIKALLASTRPLPRRLSEDLKRVNVKVFSYNENSEMDEQTVIDLLLANVHVSGPKGWGALQKAQYIHRTYLRLFRTTLGVRCRFRWETGVGQRVMTIFNLTAHKAKKALTICRVYEALRRDGYEVKPDHYTLIDLAITKRSVKDALFQVDMDRCTMSETGRSRFARLCIEPDCKVKNPGDFKLLANVWAGGTPADQRSVLQGPDSLSEVTGRLDARSKRDNYRKALEQALLWLDELHLSEFQGTAQERALVKKLSRAVRNLELVAGKTTR